jgi:type IV pilus biogenesis protein CpaD/CtpE
VRILLIAASVLALAGCVSNQNDLGDDFGTAFKANNAAQIIDPTPAVGAPEGNGAAVDLATVRYKTDKVKKPNAGPVKQSGSPGGSPQQ